jgi:hypothetical protein
MRRIWIAVAAASVLSVFWMSTVPDHIRRQQFAVATGYAESALTSCRAAHIEESSGFDCRRVEAIAFESALDPIVRMWPTWGPRLYAGVGLALIWAIALGIAFAADWLRRGFRLWHTA